MYVTPEFEAARVKEQCEPVRRNSALFLPYRCDGNEFPQRDSQGECPGCICLKSIDILLFARRSHAAVVNNDETKEAQEFSRLLRVSSFVRIQV